MKDKLIKLNKKKTPALDVIDRLDICGVFYDWLKIYNPVKQNIYSIKRLAKMFLAEYPSYYSQYEKLNDSLAESIKIATFNAYEE